MQNASQQSAHQALFRACMKDAALQGKALMHRLVAQAGNSLARGSAMGLDDLERKLLSDASRLLAVHEPALGQAYPQALLAEFAQAIAGDARKPSTLSFDSLELMGDEQMQESVDQMRLQQAVTSQAEAELSELNTLLCAVQGLKTMPAERSPLRPEVFVRSLRKVVKESPVAPPVQNRWIHHMGDALGVQLARVYKDLADNLRSQGVTPAGFNAAPMREAGSPGQAAAHQEIPASALLNLKELRRLLSGEFDSRDQHVIAAAARGPEFSMTVPAALETLQEMKQVDQVMARLRHRHSIGDVVDVTGDASVREVLRAKAHRPGQALALEVVDLMIDKIASDPRLLPPVQQTVRELEPALLRLAMDDPRFFSDRKHPARRLLEQMTQRSLAWESIEAPGFAAFIEPLQQAVEVLLSTRIPGAEPFEFALTTLEQAWGEAQQRDRHHREKAVRALLQAEQRNLLAGRIAKDLRHRADVQAAPREVTAFLVGPWSQVMAQARLGEGVDADDPGGYTAMVADLLWSVQPRMTPANAARLAAFGPVITDKAKLGLSTIDYPLPATQRFIDHLQRLHELTIKAAATGTADGKPIALSTSLSREELEAMMGDGDEGGEHGSWLAPTEVKHSGFVDTDQSLSPQQVFQHTQPGFSETRPGAQARAPSTVEPELPPTSLLPGAWVEMAIEGGWGRYQVTWASPHRTLFMFTSASGKQHSMTRRLLGKMLKGASLRLISDQTVVDGALDAVADEALRNSVDLKL
ncbi:MAG: DUF1631 family protein [Pseudomonadota bacterium]